MKTVNLSLLGGLIFGLLVSLAPVASAHSFPERQSPAAGQTLTSPPSEVAIKYDAPIERLFASLEVVGTDGKNETVGRPEVSPDGYTLSVKVGPLKPGEYKVKWGVVCVDTHHTQGSYTFAVASKGG